MHQQSNKGICQFIYEFFHVAQLMLEIGSNNNFLALAPTYIDPCKDLRWFISRYSYRILWHILLKIWKINSELVAACQNPYSI
jgi:hypothetical protein